MRNTKKKGLLKFFIYFDKKTQEYVGICVDLSIIKTGQNPYVVKQDLIDAAMGYVDIVCKDKDFSVKLLNQKLPEEYKKVYRMIVTIVTSKNNIDCGKNEIQTDDIETFYKSVPAELCHASC